jgi:serine/threonine-protein kinase
MSTERFGQDLILLERLAAGGMAEVFRAKQIGYGGFEKTVAVKRILPNFASDEEFKGMFRQEANLSGCLQHQSIVQVFGNG